MAGLRQDERCKRRFAVFRLTMAKKRFQQDRVIGFFIRIPFLASNRAFQKSLTV